MIFFSIFLWETSHQPIKLFPNGCKFLCLHFDFERRAGNMIFSPFDDNNVISSIADGIVDLVAVVAQVFDKDFFARAFGSVDGNEEQIGTYVKSRFISIPSKWSFEIERLTGICGGDAEGVLLVHVSLLESHAFAGDFGSIRLELGQCH